MSVPRARKCVAVACAALVLALGASACVGGPQPLRIPRGGHDPRETPGSRGDRGARVLEAALTSKVVAGKEPPTTLIAEDASRCTVTEGRYREIQIGDRALCAWRTGDRAP